MTKESYIPPYRIKDLEETIEDVAEACVHLAGAETITGSKTFSAAQTFTGQVTSSNIVPQTDDTYNIGTADLAYSNIYGTYFSGTAYRAYWGDLAEYYEADADYSAGTLMAFGGNKEVTIATEDCNAVVTTNPAVVMNGNQSFEHPCPLALVGRVPVRVIGKVKKFDLLEISEIPGVARALPNLDDFKFNNIIARALESKDTEEEGLVLCVVKFEL